MWIDPPLGPPWYKHPCMDHGYTSSGGSRSCLLSVGSSNHKEVEADLILGVVKESEVSFSKQCTITCIETEKNDRYVLLVKNNAGFLTGKMVVFTPRRKSVALFEDNNYSYGVVAVLSAPSGIEKQEEKVRCPECDALLNIMNINKHMKNQHWFRIL